MNSPRNTYIYICIFKAYYCKAFIRGLRGGFDDWRLRCLTNSNWLPFNSCVPADFSIMASSSLEESSFWEHRHHPQNPWETPCRIGFC